MRLGAVLASVTVLILAIISTTFVLLALTSSEWSRQTYYYVPSGVGDGTGENKTTNVCHAFRSPFYKCGLPIVHDNGSCSIPSCQFYKPYGLNQTSCRTASEFGTAYTDDVDALALLGYEQECQQVHYAGNLQIAASFFITLGLILALTLSLFTIIIGLGPNSQDPASSATEAEINAETAVDPETVNKGHRHHHHGSGSDPGGIPGNQRVRNPATPYIVFTLLFCLYAGAGLQILAQFFGVLGLTLNATPSQDTAQQLQENKGENFFQAQSWVVAKALSAYATVAWTSAVLCGGVVGSVFRVPRFRKLL